MGDQEFCDRLLGAFPKQAELWMTQITGAAAAGNADQLRSAAHGLKGTAANLSAGEVRRLATEIESLARDGNVVIATGLLDALRVEVDHCVKAVHDVAPAAASMTRQGVN